MAREKILALVIHQITLCPKVVTRIVTAHTMGANVEGPGGTPHH